VEPDATPCRVDFDGTAAQILKAPIESARAALNSISAGALVGVTRVQVASETLEGYFGCTPEPARSLLDKIIAGASPRELITSGSVAPRLLEAVLSDIARRGAITSIERVGEEPAPMRGSTPHASRTPSASAVASSLPPPPSLPLPSLVSASMAAPKVALSPSLAPKVDDVTAEDAGWFSLQLDSSRPPPAVLHEPVFVPVTAPMPAVASSLASARPSAPPVAEKPKGLPFSTEVTPAVDRRWQKITEGVFSDAGTMQGVGMPEVARAPSVIPAPIVAIAAVEAVPAQPKPPRPKLASAEELDALASALTEPSPSPVPVAEPPVAEPPVAEPPVAEPPVAEPPVAEPPVAMTSASVPEPTLERPSSAAKAAPEMLHATLVSRTDSQAPNAGSSRVSPLRTPTPSARVPPTPKGNAGSLIWLVFVAAAAFAVAYFVITYYRMQNAPDPSAQPSAPSPIPATS
jgi:hypothetical protein